MIKDDHMSSFISSGKTNSHGLNILKLFALDIYRINTMKRTIALPSKFVYNDMLMVLACLFRNKERKSSKRTYVLRSVPREGVKSLWHVVHIGPTCSSKTEMFFYNRIIWTSWSFDFRVVFLNLTGSSDICWNWTGSDYSVAWVCFCELL